MRAGTLKKDQLKTQLAQADAKKETVPMAPPEENLPAARKDGVLPSYLPAGQSIPMVATRDIGAVAAQALLDGPRGRRVVELSGPREYTLKALVELVCAFTHRRRLVIGLPDRLSYLQAWTLELLPGPLMTRDNYRSMQVPNTTNAEFPFGIARQALEAVAPAYLAPSGPRERYPQLRWRARR